MVKAIVTGGCGFIGSHIVDRLINDNYEVEVIDNESAIANERFYYNEKAKYHKLDVADYATTRKIYDDAKYVFHCAAESRINQTIDNPLLAFRTNVVGTATVLQCSREADVRTVLYSSTSSAYGLINSPPLHERMPEDCLNPYSVSKVAGEKACMMYNQLFGLKTVIFRYFNVYGPREPIKGPYAPVVGLFLRQKLAGESLTITGNGQQSRDFVHVYDVVNANIMAMNPDILHVDPIYNVGTGKKYSVLQLAKMIDDNIKFIPPRMGEARETLADNKRIKETFGWKPTEDLEAYIRKMKNGFNN